MAGENTQSNLDRTEAGLQIQDPSELSPLTTGIPTRQNAPPHTKTANDTLGRNGWKITSNDDQIRIRILREGKAFTKKTNAGTDKVTPAAST